MNNNFEYLDDRITTVGQAITGWETQLANVNTSLTASINNLDSAAVKLAGTQTISGNKTFSGTNSFSGSVSHSAALSCSGAATFTGTTKVPASTTTGTALQLAAQTKAGDGYIKFGSGIIVQWGSTSGSAGARSVTFPTAFSSTNVRVITQNLYTNQGNGYQGTVKSVSKTGFTGYQSYAYGLHWIAVGY